MVELLALELASTIRHDGNGGVTDDLATPEGLTSWVRARSDRLGPWATRFTADDPAWHQVISLRRATRSLLAQAVRPGPPSPADAHRLLPLDEAINRVNTAAALVPTVPHLQWLADSPPRQRVSAIAAAPTPTLTATLARATIDLLTGPHRPDLRACTAPRCVRYFLKTHGRQEFCKPSCGNRARAARHYHRHRDQTPADT